MDSPRRIAQGLLTLSITLGIAACSPTVTNLEPATTTPAWPESPFPAAVMVEPFDGAPDEGIDPQEHWAGRLAQILEERRVFAVVQQPNDRGGQADLILRADIDARWDARGVGNFFTWWPGGLVLAPNWYGTRMNYFVGASVDLLDAGTSEVLGSYEASMSYELAHRSASPGPFFGAIIIIPAVVKGITVTWPRASYKRKVYPVAYAELWEQIASEIVTERAPGYAAKARERAESCGDRLDLAPRIGQAWNEFRDCQSAYYQRISETASGRGVSSVFQNPQDSSRIYVIDGAITNWEQPTMTPAVAAPPPTPN